MGGRGLSSFDPSHTKARVAESGATEFCANPNRSRCVIQELSQVCETDARNLSHVFGRPDDRSGTIESRNPYPAILSHGRGILAK